MDVKKRFSSTAVRGDLSPVASAVRRALRPGASMLALGALGALVSLPTRADTAATPDSTTAPDQALVEITVTALRQSLQTSQDVKKNAEEIVDSVNAQDIGALPDRSVAEALQRIPGVQIERTDNNRDPARPSIEGGNVFIRGLPWVLSEVNGRDVFSATDGRALTWEDFSSDLLTGIDVYKNPSADQIEGGIGGIINLRSRQPFDSEKPVVAASVDYNYSDLIQKSFTSGNLLLSDQWETGIGRIGALASFSIGNAGNRSDSIQTGAYHKETSTTGSTVYLPDTIGWRTIDWEQRRRSAAGALQWAPTDKLVLSFNALITSADPKNLEHALADYNGPPLVPQPGNVYGANGVVQSGTVADTLLVTDTRFEQDHKSTKDFSVNAKWTPTDNWTLSADAQYVKSHADLVSLTGFTELSNAVPAQLNYNLSGNTPSVKFSQSPYTAANQGAYWWAAAMDHLENNDAHAWAERLDADYKFDDNPWLRSLRLGVRATNKEAITRETGYNWAFLSNAFWDGGASNPKAAYLNNSALAPASASELYSFGHFFNGKVAPPGEAWFPSASLVSHGTAYAYSILKNTETSGWGWTPLTSDYSQAQPAGDNANGGINEQHEKTFATYALLRFAHPSPIGDMDGNVGVRWVHTEMNTNPGLIRIGNTGSGTPDSCAAAAAAEVAAGLTPVDCANFDASYAFSKGSNQALAAARQSYNDVLPTLNIRFMLKEDLQLRFAAGHGVVRPSFSQLQNNVSLGFGYNPDFTTKTGTFNGNSGTAGNPNLKPTTVNQFDSSLEWYFAPAGSLTADVFYKDIKNYIFAGTETETYTSNGQTLKFYVTRQMNGDSGKIKGVELAYQQFYDMLPGPLSGLGLQANYTYVKDTGGRNTAQDPYDTAQLTGATGNLPIEGISKDSYNLAGIYEKYGISARLAYNWRGRYLLTTSAANIKLPVWSEAYGQLDASLFYSITPKIKIGLQAENLLDSRTFLDVGPSNEAPLIPRYSWTDTDRRVSVAIRASL